MPYKNKEDQVASIKAYYQANKEKRIAYGKAYRKENKEKITLVRKLYKAKNKDKREVDQARRRALQVSAEAIMTKEEVENYKNLVIIRDEATALFGYEWHIDHTIPLSQGGTNAIDNLEVVPASWNLEKNNNHSQSFWG